MTPTQRIDALEDFSVRVKRVQVYSWAGAIALHATLLFWREPPEPLEMAEKKSVEIIIGREDEQVPEMLAQPQAAAKPASAGASARVKNLLAGFRSWGPWGKTNARPSPASQVKGASAGKEGKLPDIPSTWKPKSPQRIALAGQGSGGDAGAESEIPVPEKTPSGLSASPWSSQKGGEEAGGSLAGVDASDAGHSALAGVGGAPSAWPAGGGGGGELRESGGGGEGGGEGGGGSLYEVRGPMARRRAIHTVMPQYPDWALEQGLEVDVTVYFVVLPDGSVKDPILVRKTSGDPRLDDLVVQSLREWRFSPLRTRRKGEQWGLLTFHFRLRG